MVMNSTQIQFIVSVPFEFSICIRPSAQFKPNFGLIILHQSSFKIHLLQNQINIQM